MKRSKKRTAQREMTKKEFEEFKELQEFEELPWSGGVTRP